jgi:AraC family transcriptional regulator
VPQAADAVHPCCLAAAKSIWPKQYPLHVLAKVVHLSAYYLCRAFKQSFGSPLDRYHINRRIERAKKTLLASPEPSETDLALKLGFSETSSFSAAFRHTTGATPIDNRRTLA